jgi:hypothetical protein
MKDRITNAKKYVADRKHYVTAGVGVVIGVAFATKFPLKENWYVIELSERQLRQLLNREELSILYELPNRTTVDLWAP